VRFVHDRPTVDVAEAAAALAPLRAEDRIAWAVEKFGGDVVLLSSMQKTGIVLMHMIHRLGLPNEILFIDTGYHFVQTLRLRDQTMRTWKLNLVTLYPEISTEEQETRFGKKLFTCTDGQPECCRLRKETPLLKHLETKQTPVLVNGLRRDEGGRRANLTALGPDLRTGGYQLSPIFDWSKGDIEAYITVHGLPVHPLYDQCYASIGCYPCTTPIRPGEDARAGRWRHLRVVGEEQPAQYCGVNFSDGSGI
jgi:phosphoadenosine phosphosulfate reductase